MGNTFLLKNALGQIAGFLVQKDTEIVYKFDPKTREETEIIFQFDDGTLEHKRIAFSGKEGSLHSVGKKIKGVAVTAPDEEVILRAGEHFQITGSKVQVTIGTPAKKEKTVVNAQTGENEAGYEMKHLQLKGKKITENQWPQRRWPPPPCMCFAAYERGRWNDEE